MSHLDVCLNKAVRAVAQGFADPNLELTAFFPVKGAKSVGELMVVGQAVNGWGQSWKAREALDPNRRQVIIEAVMAPAWARGKCPMSWVSADWGTRGYVCVKCGAVHEEAKDRCPHCGEGALERRYDPARSAFWQVSQSVTETLRLADTTKDEWPSHLMWSDLYKISPAAGRNPSDRLIAIQQEACVEMLKAEIQEWRPRRVLFLTGFDWAQPFISGLDESMQLKAVGTTHEGIYNDPLRGVRAAIVVTAHPQGKPGTASEKAKCIVDAFARWCV